MASKDPQNTSQLKENGDEFQSTPSKKKAGKKGNSGSSRKMTAKEQSERFIQTARELEVDENNTKFEAALSKTLALKK